MLDEMIDFHVEKEIQLRQQQGFSTSPETIQRTREYMLKQVMDEAFDRMESEKIDALNKSIRVWQENEMEKAKIKLTKFKMKQISGIISETIFLAFFIGLMVNQITGWIDASNSTVVSVGVTVLCAAAVILFKHLLANSRLLEDENGNGGT